MSVLFRSEKVAKQSLIYLAQIDFCGSINTSSRLPDLFNGERSTGDGVI